MKILIFYTRNKGLLSEFFQELSEKLVCDGHDVFNFYLKHKKEFFVHEGVKIYGEKRGGYFKNYSNIRNIIKLTKPDLIISNFSYVNPSLLFGRLFRTKRNVVWFHTVYGHGKPNKFKILIKRLFLKMADVVIANSGNLQEEMHRIYGVPKTRTYSIPFWTNIPNYRVGSKSLSVDTNSSTFKIGCPGRLLEDKNHKVVIEAIHELKKKHKRDILLYIAGGGPDKNTLEMCIASMGLESHVTFLGVLSVNQMVEFYDAMDIVVLPSLNEAFGLVFIEAIALGRPVIVSTQFGALNFIDTNKFSLDDFTFNPKSVSELHERLVPYLTDNGIPSIYFENLYKSTFDKEVIYEQIKNIFTEGIS